MRGAAMTDPRDVALQASCPVIAAPRFGPLPPMEYGQRVVLARNGVFLQVRRAWLRCTERIGHVDPRVPLPFGALENAVRFHFGTPPQPLLREFIAEGRRRLPNEVAGGLVYSSRSSRLRLAVYESLSSGPDGVNYVLPRLAHDEVVAIDLHTHGADSAYFSEIDDADDLEVKVAGVIGDLDRTLPSTAYRLVLNGYFIPLEDPWPLADGPV